MKSNVVMRSKDRDLLGVTIRQETKSGFLSVSDLQLAYDKSRVEHGWSERRIDSITQTHDFKERAFYLLDKQGFINTTNFVFMEMIKNEGLTNILKRIGVYKTTGRGLNKTTYANPYIWVLLAMEMNPKIYANVVMWLTDSLIFNRIEACDEFKPMNKAISSIIQDPEYSKYAIAINNRVFGQHMTGIRNLATAEELKQISKLENFITQGIEMQMIKDDNHIMHIINTITIKK